MWRELLETPSRLFTAFHLVLCIPVALLFVAIPFLFIGSVPLSPSLRLLLTICGLLPAIVILAAGHAAWQARKPREALFLEEVDLDWIKNLSWQDFEQQVAEVYRQRGYAVAEVGAGAADGAIDLVLVRDGQTAIVQCRRWKTYKVGDRHLRELLGAMLGQKADRAIFITSGVYTEEALQLAAENPIELIDGAKLAEMLRPSQSSLKASLS